MMKYFKQQISESAKWAGDDSIYLLFFLKVLESRFLETNILTLQLYETFW